MILRSIRSRLWISALAFLSLEAPALHAQTDEIQVYDAQIAAPGVINLTWHDNYTPSGQLTPAAPGVIVPNHSLNGVPEWAYGVTDWFEAGLYLPLYTVTGGGAVLLNGFKLRALFVEPDALRQRFIYGVNFEFSYNAPHWDPRRYSSEIRPIVGWHLGSIDFILNPILDNSYQGWSNLEFRPAMRLAWNPSEQLAIALEEYADLGPLKHFYAGDRQSHQLFPTFDFRGSKLSVEVALGFGLTSGSDHRVIKLILSRDLRVPSR